MHGRLSPVIDGSDESQCQGSRDSMVILKSRTYEEIAANLFSWFDTKNTGANSAVNEHSIGNKFILRAVYDQDTFTRTISHGSAMISKYLENLNSENSTFIEELVDIWWLYYSFIIPKIELIFRNLTDVKIFRRLLITFGGVLISSRCQKVLLGFGKLADHQEVSKETRLKIKQMLGLVISAWREEIFPLNNEALTLYSIYESLLGPESYLIE
ncbi:hypothetical protein RF11_04515 [Thelohanellus kitauei]|uniref:Uncharacterized protein n=1 Tax=Thelohanellus kitauei TaxID=669202 RepID=A0A0C2N196_THEKT|nr:hypothetical protein RF11_04515 [Thelohanellus kitauei]